MKEKVLLTGSTGFVGSHLAPELLKAGYDVYCLVRYSTGRLRGFKQVFCDLRDHSTVQMTVRDVMPDFVIHLGAITPVAYSFDHTQEVNEVNYLGTINLAEACRRYIPHLKQFLFASTSETYGNSPDPVKIEESQQWPCSPYAVSKLACERYLLYMRDAYNFPVTILRPFNTYGRKNDAHFITENAISQMLTSDVARFIDPEPIRDFMYIDDHVRAYMTCLNNPKAIGEVFNFCTGEGISIRELVEKIAELIGFRGEILWWTGSARPLEIKVLVGSYEKAKRILGWSPEVSLEEGLKLTIEYWRKVLKKEG